MQDGSGFGAICHKLVCPDNSHGACSGPAVCPFKPQEIDPVTLASCRYRAIDIIWGAEGDGKTCGDVRMILESEYGAEVCRKALGPDEPRDAI